MRFNGYIVAGGALLLLAGGLAALQNREESAGTVTGAAIGAMLIGLVVAWLGRLIWVRVIKRDGAAVMVPGLLLASGVVAVLGAFSAAGNEERDREEFASEAEECQETQREPLTTPPPGFSYQPLDPQQVRDAEEMFSRTGLPTEVLEGRNVLRRAKYVGGVFVFAGADDAEEFLSGVRRAAEDSGMPITETSVQSNDAVLTSGPVVQISAVSGCYGMTAGAFDAPTANDIADAVVREGEAP